MLWEHKFQVNVSTGSLFFSQNLSRDFEARRFSLNGNGTRLISVAHLLPYLAILLYRSFAFAMTKYLSKPRRLSEP